MSTEARKVMTMSMVKITSSRTRKNGISLRQNLLVANVLLSARSVFLSNAAETRTRREAMKRQHSITAISPVGCRDQFSAKVTSTTANDDAVVPDMDDQMSICEEQDSTTTTTANNNKTGDESPSRKRLHDDDDTDVDDDHLAVLQPVEKRTQKELTALNSLVNRFSGLLEQQQREQHAQEQGHHASRAQSHEEPTTDGFINTCSTRVIDDYDAMSNRPIQMQV